MRKKILIVDDEDEIRFTIKEGLTQLSSDFDVSEASNGQVALNKLKEEQFDLVIIDIMMPVMDGWQLSGAIKQDPVLKDIPILFLSAKTDEYSKTLGKMSAVDYVEKPFELIQLKEKIDSFI